MRAKRASVRGQVGPTPALRQCSTRGMLGSRLLGLGSRLVGSARGVDGLMGFGPNWAFLGLNFWVLLGKLAQIQLFSSKNLKNKLNPIKIKSSKFRNI